MSNTVIYPGTFDPLTNGHMDLILRAAKIFDHVIVAVAEHTSKMTLLAFDERIALCQAAVSHIKNVKIKGYQKLLISFAREQNVFLILRGVRAIADFEYERQLSRMNNSLENNIETIFMTPQEKYAHISSTFVKDIARLGGNIAPFVPKVVVQKLNYLF